MARIRSLKPEIWMSAQVMNLSHAARLLFLGLSTQADDDGRGSADTRRLKAAIFGGDDCTSADVRRWLDEIASQGLAVVYEPAGHGFLYELPSWRTHQRIDRPRKSNYPPPDSQPPRGPFVEPSTMIRRGSEGSEGSLGSEGSDGSEARGTIVESPSNPPDGTHRIRIPRQVPVEDMLAIRTDYPEGTFPESDWQQAERLIGQILGDGTPLAKLRENVQAFNAQQAACGTLRTQFIPRPSKFFAGDPGPWRGPFRIPEPKQQPAKETAMDRIRRASGAGDDDRTFEGEVIRG